MATIDLNSDLGENTPDRVVSDDESMLRIVTSANIACGFHAGSPEGIRDTVRAAIDGGVSIGAHPGYRDYQNFGRTAVEIDSSTLQAHVEYQLGALGGLAAAQGGRMSYVKPHGALYNTIARDERQAKVVVAAIKAIDPDLVLLGLAGGVVLPIAEKAGVAVAAEAFADRAYQPDGQLVSRTQPGAVLHDPVEVAQRMLGMVEHGVLPSIDGSEVAIDAQSICVHGDSPGSVEMAAQTRRILQDSGVTIAPFAGP